MDEQYSNLNIQQGLGFLEGICEYARRSEFDDEDWKGYIFRLNGKNYAIWENPGDGYRSYCGVEETDLPCKNTFPPQKVFVVLYDDRDGYDNNEGIYIYNLDDASLILKVGTDNYDDYYPCAVMEYHPENMPINKGK